ncbi:FG-GAP repeat domain-containing protein [Streptomyces reniochalinae]|nr:FG-GAP and VCBS repeat-containing protein [Streptomyces reniochalinae]
MPQHRIMSPLEGKHRKWVAGVAAVVAVGAVSTPLLWSGSGDRAEAKGTALTGPAGTRPQADFDNDGRADQVSASPNAEVSGTRQAGYLAVTYGSDRPGAGRHQLVGQDSEGVPGKPSSGAGFGGDSTARDFDADGYTDLAVTSSVGEKSTVIVLWGSKAGLHGGTYLKDAAGEVTTAVGGDFDGDKKADLVTGFGSEGLLKGPFTRDGTAAGTGDVPEPHVDDKEGDEIPDPSLEAAGDLNGDHTDDLVTLSSNETDDNTNHVVWASRYLQGGKDGFAKPAKSHIPANGAATVGDVDDDGYGDLVVSRRGEQQECGVLTVVYGTSEGPGPRRTTLTKGSADVPGQSSGACDYTALDAGDVDGDGHADVLGGADLDSPGKEQSGSATLVRGSKDGLTGEGAQRFRGKSFSSDEGSADSFGLSVNLADQDGDGKSDLAIGHPGREDNAGAVYALPGAEEKLPTEAAVTLRPKDFRLSGSLTKLGYTAPDLLN